MPVICTFYGILIRMFYDDHAPPHFHAAYGDQKAVIQIETLAVMKSNMSRRALGFVLEWAELHQDALRENWQRTQSGVPLIMLQPLD
jgi:hypothetical protein